tara:strand:+ start:3653 stop:3820 length:168 start_codon:yes stop_codon:yes gene_type:complete
MARLLEQSFADAPDDYDAITFQRILRDIEMALSKKDFPQEIESLDGSRAITWFMS